MKITHTIKLSNLIVFIAVFTMWVVAPGLVLAEDTGPDPQPPLPTVESVGSLFTVTNPDYSVVTLQTNDDVNIILESKVGDVTAYISSASAAATTQVKVSGLPQSTTYYKYVDNDSAYEEMFTSSLGELIFHQEIATPHLVRLRSTPGTVYIPSDTTVGNWDSVSRIYTLTTNVNDHIQITESDLTLDGNGFTASAPVPEVGDGILVFDQSNVTIKNITVQNFLHGIQAYMSDEIIVTDTTILSNKYHGVFFNYANDGNVQNNSFDNNGYSFVGWGSGQVYLRQSDYNIIDGNVIDTPLGPLPGEGHKGIFLEDHCDYNIITNNIVQRQIYGVNLHYFSSNNTVMNNTMDSSIAGMELYARSNYNYVRENILSNSTGPGINLRNNTQHNTIVNNQFIDNIGDGAGGRQALATWNSWPNTWNLDAASGGGNYWNDWTSPDLDQDGFVDIPYVFTGGTDYLPLVAPPDDEGPVTSHTTADPAPVSTQSTVTAQVDDSETGGSLVAAAEYSIDSVAWNPMDAVDGSFDSQSEWVSATILPIEEAGIYSVCVRGVDEHNNVGDPECVFMPIFDPDGGFVTGGGWIDSPQDACAYENCTADTTGKANFGFVSKYKKGASTPTGQTQFQFSAGNLDFHSDSYQWLVVNQGGTNAQYKGEGTVNGSLAPTGEAYKFMIWAKDGDKADPVDADTFRIKIWYEGGGEVVVYDNGFDQAIGGGSIVIHTAKRKK